MSRSGHPSGHVTLVRGPGRGWGGQSERIYLVRVELFEPAAQLDLAAEKVAEIRWWTLEELDRRDLQFAPRRLPALVRNLLGNGPPPEPIDAGV
jgi:hypothetical protein